jgi:hypothetical protein
LRKRGLFRALQESGSANPEKSLDCHELKIVHFISGMEK